MNGPLVVVGDSLLDIDTEGRAVRLSPDGPVPVVEDSNDHRRVGGAALTASLATGGGRPVRLVTPLADDDAARQLRALLPAQVELVALPWTGSTPVKNRVRAGGHTVTRIDRGGRRGVVGLTGDPFAGAAAVLVSDYGYGAVDASPVRAALDLARRRGPTVWDPHPRGAGPLQGTTLVVPNEAEAGLTPGEAPLGRVGDRACELRRSWRVGDVAVTCGARGVVTTVGPGSPFVVPATDPGPVADACGAGDRFAAAVTLALADGAVTSEAMTAGVAAASAFVAAGAARAVTGGAAARRVTVATGGCFDLLHAGHVATLEAARRLGDELVVCLNSDVSVRRLKGAGRPLQPAADRARVLKALACVDRVEVFDEPTPEALLRRLRPEVWVKGGDYAGTALPEARVLAEWGGRAVTVPYLSGRSTTGLVGLARRSP